MRLDPTRLFIISLIWLVGGAVMGVGGVLLGCVIAGVKCLG